MAWCTISARICGVVFASAATAIHSLSARDAEHISRCCDAALDISWACNANCQRGAFCCRDTIASRKAYTSDTRTQKKLVLV